MLRFKYLLAACVLSLTIGAANASSILADGTFLQPIIVGDNAYPSTAWADWTNAGATTHVAPSGIPGNYASLPNNTDLFEYFYAAPGNYTLSFLVQNTSTWSAQLVVGFDTPYIGEGFFCPSILGRQRASFRRPSR